MKRAPINMEARSCFYCGYQTGYIVKHNTAITCPRCKEQITVKRRTHNSKDKCRE